MTESTATLNPATRGTDEPPGTFIAGTLSSTEPVKPGWKTTEFWLGLGAKILGALYAGGFIGTGTIYERIAGLAVVVLAYFGYSVSRGLAKQAGAMLLVLLIGSSTLPSTGCATTGSTLKSEAQNVEGCSAADVVAILTASQRIREDFANPDREAALIDGAQQLAIIHAAWSRCKATAKSTTTPATTPATTTTPTAERLLRWRVLNRA
jgi:hypothetical protein